MNKKFSTLMAASLVLAGSLWSGDAWAEKYVIKSISDLNDITTTVTDWKGDAQNGQETNTDVWQFKTGEDGIVKGDEIVFAEEITFPTYGIKWSGSGYLRNCANFLNVNVEGITITAEGDGAIVGQLQISADNVTVKNLPITVNTCNNQPTANKTGIVLDASVEKATISNNTITEATNLLEGFMTYGIVVKGNDVAGLKIKDNNLAIQKKVTTGDDATYLSTALTFTGLTGKTNAAADIASQNTFEGSVFEYADVRQSKGESYYYSAQVSLPEDATDAEIEVFQQAVIDMAANYNTKSTQALSVNNADANTVIDALANGTSNTTIPADFALVVGNKNVVAGKGSVSNDNQDITVEVNADGSVDADAAITAWDADDLNALLGNGFMLNLTRPVDAETSLTINNGNVLAGKLLYLETKSGSTYLKVGDKYLAFADTQWENVTGIGERLTLVSKIDDAEKVTVLGNSDEKSIVAIQIGDDELYLTTVKAGTDTNPQIYLTTTEELPTVLNIAIASDTRVNAYDKKNNPFRDRYVTLTFVTTDKNLKAKNGKVLGLDNEGNYSPELVEAARYLQAVPEAQWVVSLSDEDSETQFTFTNREAGSKANAKFDALYLNVLDAANNKYTISYDDNEAMFSFGERDTFIINPVDPKLTVADFYTNYKETEIKDTQYKLAVASTEETDFYVTENHAGKHLLGLTKEKDYSVNWRVVATGDTAIVISNSYDYDKKGFKAVADTLFVPTYAFQNAGNKEYMTYIDKNKVGLDEDAMYCDPDSKDYNSEAGLTANNSFVLKKKANGLFNIIGVAGKISKDNKYYTLDLSKKLFGATTTKQGQIQVEESWEQINSNDLFKLVSLDAPEYHKVAKGFGEIVSIYRADNNSQVLYEKADKNSVVEDEVQSFLNIDNVHQFDKINPAMFVDTAYINRGTKENPNTCWQYLLAVNADVHDPDTCTVPGHPRTDRMVTARYLVNLIDTANVYGATHLHNNPYINEGEAGENLAKLAFVDGIHINDTLYIIRNNGDSVKLELDTPDFNVAKFAFRYVNPANESDKTFKIQTQYKNYIASVDKDDVKANEEAASNEGYLKWINGTVVVVPTYERGDVFGINEEETQDAVNNEAIDASAISVSTIDGAVVVKGAEGKNVVITNVLGQQVANTVASSNEVTISAPAGIVVVAVEGEAAVKAIVK
ncbi:DUF6383 domain-containing protein [uncultured Parabacteroides sp.]|uniref:DUF6383 domain-containing protein n=1 Tax=uncultured Parabacteroides sp. TaxID=512312 RepID=UPI00259B4785|nr:DUF6383 domain-containing protein [uncultured Parabacteroides sp.]